MALELKPESTEVQSQTGSSSLFNHRIFQRKLNVRDRMFFTEQLALLLETGTSLHASLKVIRLQITEPGMQVILDGLMERIAEGVTFSAALSRFPELFPLTYINLIGAAENGGFLHKVLEELLEMDEKRERLRSKLMSSLSYPVFLVLFSLGVVIFVLVVVFPKFADMFDSIRDELPGTTLVLMQASHLLLNYWWALIAGLGILVAGLTYTLKMPQGRMFVDRAKLTVFPFRNIFSQLYLVQSMRVMGLSLANGVSVMDTLAACRGVVENSVFRQFLMDVEHKVQQGEGIAAAFQQAEFIPPAVRQMVTTGDETGTLPRVMSRVADHYERELGKRLEALSRLVEPLMLIVMGGVVGLIVSSLILPIFKLSRAVS